MRATVWLTDEHCRALANLSRALLSLWCVQLKRVLLCLCMQWRDLSSCLCCSSTTCSGGGLLVLLSLDRVPQHTCTGRVLCSFWHIVAKDVGGALREVFVQNRTCLVYRLMMRPLSEQTETRNNE